MHMEVNQSELNYNVERPSIDHIVPGNGPGEPDMVPSEPYLDPWASEAIRFGC